ncbi:hypothetical protein QE429_003422 [Bacillus sp. SORGH_AS 510]|nr:hypothetical protein [Bacillus sp. SORGH_AS_0510]
MIVMSKEIKPLKKGQTFGRLAVIGKDIEKSRERKKPYYICKCSCGVTKSILKQSLVDKKKPTNSCGCLVKELAGFKHDRKTTLSMRLYEKVRARHINTLEDSIDNLLPFDMFCQLIINNCFYCNALPDSYITDRSSGSDFVFHYNGLDRVDSKLGYRAVNVVPACKHCNMAKSTLSEDDFKGLIKRIYELHLKEGRKNNV